MKHGGYTKEILTIGLPVTIQSIFQASYSLVDQLMVGTLGTVSIASSGLGATFSSLAAFTLSAVASVASILISQYHGTEDEKGVGKSFSSCLFLGLLVMLVFLLPSVLCPTLIMSIYTEDAVTVACAAGYLRIIGISFFPMILTLVFSAMFRSLEKSKYPMYASILSMVMNILLNYILIFGKLGFPALGLTGAAIGTLASRTIEAGFLMVTTLRLKHEGIIKFSLHFTWDGAFYRKICVIMVPIVVNEFSWSVGENIYAAIYGRLGTDNLAAMTLTNPLQGMFIGCSLD